MYSQLTAYGRLTRDPELRYVNSANGQIAVCNVTIACSDVSTSSGEKREYTAYYDFVFWAGQAETIAKHLKKGDPILVTGSGRTETWDAADGTKRSRLRFRGKEFRFSAGTKAREKPSAPEGAPHGLPSPFQFPNSDTIAGDLIDDALSLGDDIPF